MSVNLGYIHTVQQLLMEARRLNTYYMSYSFANTKFMQAIDSVADIYQKILEEPESLTSDDSEELNESIKCIRSTLSTEDQEDHEELLDFISDARELLDARLNVQSKKASFKRALRDWNIESLDAEYHVLKNYIESEDLDNEYMLESLLDDLIDNFNLAIFLKIDAEKGTKIEGIARRTQEHLNNFNSLQRQLRSVTDPYLKRKLETIFKGYVDTIKELKGYLYV